MNISAFFKDMQTLLAPLDVPHYREEEVPPDQSPADLKDGFVAWTADFTNILKCSNKHLQVVEGNLEVIAYSTSRTKRQDLFIDCLDILIPGSPRTSIAPRSIGDCYLHQLIIENIEEVYAEKEGHPVAEVKGMMATFYIKVSLPET